MQVAVRNSDRKLQVYCTNYLVIKYSEHCVRRRAFLPRNFIRMRQTFVHKQKNDLKVKFFCQIIYQHSFEADFLSMPTVKVKFFETDKGFPNHSMDSLSNNNETATWPHVYRMGMGGCPT